MTTPTTDHDAIPNGPRSENRPGRRRAPMLAGAAAALIVAVGAIALVTRGDDESGDTLAGPPLELSVGESSALASCIAFDVNILAGMSPAFAGTATSVDGEAVTLTVDRWYTGGDAASVVLRAPTGLEALIDGFDFEVGRQYLITAAGGSVNFCGFSGPATPELTAAYDAAFPG